MFSWMRCSSRRELFRIWVGAQLLIVSVMLGILLDVSRNLRFGAEVGSVSFPPTVHDSGDTLLTTLITPVLDTTVSTRQPPKRSVNPVSGTVTLSAELRVI